MNMNRIGKGLVLFQLVLSVLLLTWAAATFLSPVDWGRREAAKAWMDPPEGKTTPVNERLAARVDEAIAGYAEFVKSKGLALERYKMAEKSLAPYPGRFGANHVVYAAELKRIENGEGPQKFLAVKYNDDGSLARNPAAPWGQVVLGTPVPGEKSYAAYLVDLDEKTKAIQAVGADIEKWVELKKKLTIQLNGAKDDKGNEIKPGLYDLVEREAAVQKKLETELAYLQPLWVRELYNANLLRERRKGLEARLIELGQRPSEILQD
jgi:hypothetical protein